MADVQDQVEPDQVENQTGDLAKQFETAQKELEVLRKRDEIAKREKQGLDRRISELSKEKEDLEMRDMTAAEKATAELRKLEQEKAELSKEVALERLKRYKAGKVNELKLPGWVTDRLTGSNEAEVDVDAQRIAEMLADYWEEETARKYKGKIPRISGEGEVNFKDLESMTDAEINVLSSAQVAEIVAKAAVKH